MQIVNGITADAGWTKQLAYSPDGINWKTLSKANLRVKTAITNGNTESPLVSSTARYVIELMHGDETLLRFKLSDITNQAGWTLTSAGMIQAVDDINTWIAT